MVRCVSIEKSGNVFSKRHVSTDRIFVAKYRLVNYFNELTDIKARIRFVSNWAGYNAPTTTKSTRYGADCWPPDASIPS